MGFYSTETYMLAGPIGFQRVTISKGVSMWGEAATERGQLKDAQRVGEGGFGKQYRQHWQQFQDWQAAAKV